MTVATRMTKSDVCVGACRLTCDTLSIEFDGASSNELLGSASGGCRECRAFFDRIASDTAKFRSGQLPAAMIAGKKASPDTAVAEARRLLSEWRAPLVLGPSRGSVESARAAVAIAERIQGTIDFAASTGHRASTIAFQRVGLSTATLGEVRDRADLIIFWNADPLRDAPEFVDRYAGPTVRHANDAKASPRRRFVVHTKPNETAKIADRKFDLSNSQHAGCLEFVQAIRRAWKARTANDAEEEDSSPIAAPLDKLASELLSAILASRYVAMIVAADDASLAMQTATAESLYSLVRELNDRVRCVALPFEGAANATNENVLCWQTGYPLGVSFANGSPSYEPEEHSAESLLAQRAIDGVIVIGGEMPARLSSTARAALSKLPMIALIGPNELRGDCAVEMACAVDGVHRPGTVFRLDGAPLPLRTLIELPLPSVGETLAALLARE